MSGSSPMRWDESVGLRLEEKETGQCGLQIGPIAVEIEITWRGSELITLPYQSLYSFSHSNYICSFNYYYGKLY